MATFGEKLQKLRKESQFSQKDLGDRIGTSGQIIGRYEKDKMIPSIEVVKRIADTFNVSIDYLVDNKNLLSNFRDKQILERITEIEKLPFEDKQHLYYIIDSVIRDTKTRQAYS